MKSKILDCTIRDGGIVNNFQFTNEFVKNLISMDQQIGCEYCEIGYFSNKLCKESKWKSIDFKNIEIPPCSVKLSVMGDINTFSLDDIPNRNKTKISLIRVAGFYENIQEILDILSEISNCLLNIMAISQYNEDILKNIVSIINKNSFKPTFLYFADSFGALEPDNIIEIMKYLKLVNNVKLGFHPHNNRQLAFANYLRAQKIGIDIIDATVCGMGKCSGNLPIELIIDKNKMEYFINFVENNMQSITKNYSWGYMQKYLISSIYNASPGMENIL